MAEPAPSPPWTVVRVHGHQWRGELCPIQCGSKRGYPHGGPSAGGFGSEVRRRVAARVLDACDQDPCGLAGGGEFTLGGGFLEELVGLVAAGFGIGEDGGEGGPSGIGENAVGVVGDGGADVVDEGPASLLARLTGGEAVENGCESLIGCHLKVMKGLAGGFGLVSVALRVVPVGGEDRSPNEGGEQGGQDACVGPGGGVGDVAGGNAQGVAGLVLGADLGALSTGESS